MSVLLW